MGDGSLHGNHLPDVLEDVVNTLHVLNRWGWYVRIRVRVRGGGVRVRGGGVGDRGGGVRDRGGGVGLRGGGVGVRGGGVGVRGGGVGVRGGGVGDRGGGVGDRGGGLGHVSLVSFATHFFRPLDVRDGRWWCRRNDTGLGA